MDITLVRYPAMGLTDVQRDVLRAALFGMLDGLSDADRSTWRRFWQRVMSLQPGEVLSVSVKVWRNGKFFRKWWALAKVAYDVWTETVPTHLEHHGVLVRPSFERFRKDLIVLAGYYDPVFSATGELRLEPKSISWARMREDEFQALYSATVDVVLEKVLNGRGMTDAQLRAWVDRVMEFDW